jgi:bifunctional UDP-N-acetylglucosamine pyrophosphorylase/glucosamine-1-phosphate N-acetyltransferase
MKAIILAAGEGVRMRPLTLTIPKPLIEVGGVSLLHHLIEKLPDHIDEVILVIGYLGHHIKNTIGDSYLGKKINYVTQKEKHGTFHALTLCEPFLNENESFCLFYADDLIDKKTIDNLLRHELAISVCEIEDPRKFGVAVVDEYMYIKEIEEKPEKPKSNLVTANGCVLNKKVFLYPPKQNKNGEFYLSEAISNMAKENPVKAIIGTFWFPIATPEDVKRAEELLYKQKEG